MGPKEAEEEEETASQTKTPVDMAVSAAHWTRLICS
jgi:hypothetical protein